MYMLCSCYVDGMFVSIGKEIADELGIAVETVKKQKQVARRILKEKLGNLFSLFFLVG